MIKRIKRTIMKFPKETSALSASFAFALAGDLIYGGVAGAKESLVGNTMSSASGLFFTIFTILILFRLVFKAFSSDGFFSFAKNFQYDEPEGKKKK